MKNENSNLITHSTVDGMDYCATCGAIPKIKIFSDTRYFIRCDDCGTETDDFEFEWKAKLNWNMLQRKINDGNESIMMHKKHDNN